LKENGDDPFNLARGNIDIEISAGAALIVHGLRRKYDDLTITSGHLLCITRSTGFDVQVTA
jgi:hypothetical protein